MTRTQALADQVLADLRLGQEATGCTGPAELDLWPNLRDKLVDSSKDRFFLLQVDKTSLGFTSGGQKGHRLNFHWHTPLGGELDLSFDTPKVTREFVSADGKTREFEFSVGTVKVRKNYSTTLECDNQDTVTVIVTGFQ